MDLIHLYFRIFRKTDFFIILEVVAFCWLDDSEVLAKIFLNKKYLIFYIEFKAGTCLYTNLSTFFSYIDKDRDICGETCTKLDTNVYDYTQDWYKELLYWPS